MGELTITIRAAAWPDEEPIIRAVRTRVFVVGQGVPEERDFDGLDASCWHVLALSGDAAVGTGRMQGDGHIGRIAVLETHRGYGIGSALLRFFLNLAERKKIDRVYLNAQVRAVGFYEKLGFHRVGGLFMDAGIQHTRMERGSEGR